MHRMRELLVWLSGKTAPGTVDQDNEKAAFGSEAEEVSIGGEYGIV